MMSLCNISIRFSASFGPVFPTTPSVVLEEKTLAKPYGSGGPDILNYSIAELCKAHKEAQWTITHADTLSTAMLDHFSQLTQGNTSLVKNKKDKGVGRGFLSDLSRFRCVGREDSSRSLAYPLYRT